MKLLFCSEKCCIDFGATYLYNDHNVPDDNDQMHYYYRQWKLCPHCNCRLWDVCDNDGENGVVGQQKNLMTIFKLIGYINFRNDRPLFYQGHDKDKS